MARKNITEDSVEEVNHFLCYSALVDKNQNTVYLDTTGQFPCASLNGGQDMLVVYDYTSNTILIEPIPNLEAATLCAAHKQVFSYLKGKCSPP